jgi:hypothetical protein
LSTRRLHLAQHLVRNGIVLAGASIPSLSFSITC